MSRTFVGFGFGPINGGLFLYEAFKSGAFDRLVVAEIMPELVAAVRAGGGAYWVNVAHREGIARERVTGVEILNPTVANDCARLTGALAEAREIATALPSVDFFTRGAPAVADVLARGLEKKLAAAAPAPAVIYAGENHNHAAEILEKCVTDRMGHAARDMGRSVQFLNTVIGKMSGAAQDPEQIARDNLAPLTDGASRAFLVEEFNRILISRIRLPGFSRGIAAFAEKDDLLPFEEAKLYGHNATHALLGLLADEKGCRHMSDIAADEATIAFGRAAFLEESGKGLQRRHAGVDALFTPDGWRAYAEDLLARMMNPWLRDQVARVIRDPARKLGWDDRLIGAMRVALDAGIRPVHFARGAALAVQRLRREQPGRNAADLLAACWPDDPDAASRRRELFELIAAS